MSNAKERLKKDIKMAKMLRWNMLKGVRTCACFKRQNARAGFLEAIMTET